MCYGYNEFSLCIMVMLSLSIMVNHKNYMYILDIVSLVLTLMLRLQQMKSYECRLRDFSIPGYVAYGPNT